MAPSPATPEPLVIVIRRLGRTLHSASGGEFYPGGPGPESDCGANGIVVSRGRGRPEPASPSQFIWVGHYLERRYRALPETSGATQTWQRQWCARLRFRCPAHAETRRRSANLMPAFRHLNSIRECKQISPGMQTLAALFGPAGKSGPLIQLKSCSRRLW